MSAPSADFPALSASTSSSGYTDGLGRRSLAFDREDGTMLERLVVRAELSAFERSLRDRVERIAAMDDERLARPRSIERGADGSLVVLSEFVPGTRLADVLDTTWAQGAVPGVDVALGYLLDVLPALCGLHAGAGFPHGAISPGRTVLTPAGQVVLLDAIFGDALSRLQYSRRRLWAEFGVAMPPAAGRPRFDAASDIAQAVLSAVMLVLGRPVAEYEYPDAIPSLLVEVVDVAQIRGTSEFAAGLHRFLQRALPLPGRRPYAAADDALIEVRDLARAIGVDVCRRALVEFIEQIETGGQSASVGSDDRPGEYGYGLGDDPFAAETSSADTDDGDGFEVDLDLDGDSAEEDTVYDLSDGSDSETEPALEATVEPLPDAVPEFAAEPVDPTPAIALEAATDLEPVAAFEPPAISAPAIEEPAAAAEEPIEASIDATPDEPLAEDTPETSAGSDETAETFDVEDSQFASALPGEAESETPAIDTDAPEESGGSRRRKRSRSVRSRKDKLRSTARPQATPFPPPEPPPPPPPPPPAAKPAHGGWMIEPSRAAAFEPPVPTLAPPPPPPPPAPPAFAAPPPPPVIVAPPPPVIVAAPPPPPPPVPLAVAPPPVRPIAVTSPADPVSRPPVATPAPSPPVALKLKTTTPGGYTPPRKTRPDPMEDLYSSRTLASAPVEEKSAFPWKLASGVLVLMVIAVVVGRQYLPDRSEPRTNAAAGANVAAPTATAAPVPAVAAKTGLVQITSDPVGARVLLDGRQVGVSPLTIEVPVGRHTLTLATTTGSVRRTIKVEAGKPLNVDVPIFSGWVDVVAPIILDVSEGGKSLGTTETPRLMLGPGRHELTFSNRELDYTITKTVEIEPGEVMTLPLDPRGTVNLNATPWAEVWIDGKKAGDTPMANEQIPLGTHEIVFKHPQFGERRRTITVRAGAPVAESVDMRKQ